MITHCVGYGKVHSVFHSIFIACSSYAFAHGGLPPNAGAIADGLHIHSYSVTFIFIFGSRPPSQ